MCSCIFYFKYTRRRNENLRLHGKLYTDAHRSMVLESGNTSCVPKNEGIDETCYIDIQGLI